MTAPKRFYEDFAIGDIRETGRYRIEETRHQRLAYRRDFYAAAGRRARRRG